MSWVRVCWQRREFCLELGGEWFYKGTAATFFRMLERS